MNKQINPEKAVDFTFLELNKTKKPDLTLLNESISKQDAQIRRLDLADKLTQVEFSLQPLVEFSFEQFAKQMLL